MSYQKHQVSAEEFSDGNTQAQDKQLKIIQAIREDVPQVTVLHKYKRPKKKRKVKKTSSHQIKIKLKEIEVLRKKILDLEQAIAIHEQKLSNESFPSTETNKLGCFKFWTHMKRRPEILHYTEKQRIFSDAGDSREAVFDSYEGLKVRNSLHRRRRRSKHSNTLVPLNKSSDQIITTLTEKIDTQAQDIKAIKSNVEKCLLLLKDQKFPFEAKTFNTNLSPAALMFDDCFKSFNRVMPARNYDNVFLRPLTKEQFTELAEENETRMKLRKSNPCWCSASSGTESAVTIRVNTKRGESRRKKRRKSCCSRKRSCCSRKRSCCSPKRSCYSPKKSCCSTKKSCCSTKKSCCSAKTDDSYVICDKDKCLSFTSAKTLRAHVFTKDDTKPNGCFIRFIRFIFCR